MLRNERGMINAEEMATKSSIVMVNGDWFKDGGPRAGIRPA
jgi:hypothetical protein